MYRSLTVVLHYDSIEHRPLILTEYQTITAVIQRGVGVNCVRTQIRLHVMPINTSIGNRHHANAKLGNFVGSYHSLKPLHHTVVVVHE